MDQRTPPEERLKHGHHDEDDEHGGEQKPVRFGEVIRAHPWVTAFTVLALIAAIVAGVLWWLDARHYEWTDDAFIDSRQFAISSKVAGYIQDVMVTDNQRVSAGNPIVKIDPRDYQASYDQAKAKVAQAAAAVGNADAQIAAQKAQVAAAEQQRRDADAALVFAKQENDRAQALVKTAVGTVQRAQQTNSQLEQAQATASRAKANVEATQKQVDALEAQRVSALANVEAAKADEDLAALNLSYTNVVAAQSGKIVQLTAAKGQYVQVGQNLMMFVPTHLWVTANFKETQITDMRPGQPVDIEVDAYPDRKLKGHVASLQAGSGTAFSLLPAENATGNYVKVVQRVPVKIEIDDPPTDVTLGPGMSIIPQVKVR
jgi:membrane fusion protein, multidrug efflux system